VNAQKRKCTRASPRGTSQIPSVTLIHCLQGLAKRLDVESIHLAGQLIGNIAHMEPEQTTGNTEDVGTPYGVE
jgi:hypothetical protein